MGIASEAGSPYVAAVLENTMRFTPAASIASTNASDDEKLIGHLFSVAKQIAAQEGIAEDGYRLVINTNTHGGQTVFHIHLHLLGGRQMKALG